MRSKYFTSVSLMVIMVMANFLPAFSLVVFAEGEVEVPIQQIETTQVEATQNNTDSTSTETQEKVPDTNQTNSENQNTDEQNLADEEKVLEDIKPQTETSTPLISNLLDPEQEQSSSTIATSTENLTDTNATSTEDQESENLLESVLDLIGGDATGTASTSEMILEFNSSGTTTLGTTTEATSTLESFLLLATTTDASTATDTATTTLPTGSTTIDTGEAVATANVLNILNTNSVNSTGTIQMANLTEGHDGDLDFRSGSVSSGGGGASCTLLQCNGIDSVTANIQSDASIENTLVLQASSGGNAIDTAGQAVINTGETLAGLNLVNVANVNFIDSSYFLLSLNSFKDINGDIVLPSLSTLLSLLVDSAGPNLNNVTTASNALTENNLDVSANTGVNDSENSLTSTINSGDANTATNVYNNINTNLFGGKSIAILLRVTGKWIGEILGLSDGTTFEKDGNLYTLVIDDGTSENVQQGNTTDIFSTTTAKITNDVILLADSGNNRTLNTLESTINTGNSLAANVVNIANSNIVGRSWMLAIINIFGDFNGNIVFGRPDLQVTQNVSPPGQVVNGTELAYTVKVKNIGDRKAKGIVLSNNYDKSHLDILTSSVPFTTLESGGISFSLGELESGEVKEVSFSAKVKDASPGASILNTAIVTGSEKDNNNLDNTNTLALSTYSSSGGGGGGTFQVNGDSSNNNLAQNVSTTTPNGFQIAANNFEVIRQTKDVSVYGDEKVLQKVILKNLANTQIENAIFYDIIYNSEGQEIQRETWELGKILANEEIELTYNIVFGTEASDGKYSLSSELAYSPGKKVFFENNGSLTFERIKILVEEIPELTNSLSLTSSVVPKVSGYDLQSEDISEPPEESLQILIPATSTIVASIEGGGGGQNSFIEKFLTLKDNYYLMLLLLSILTSSMYVFVKRNVM